MSENNIVVVRGGGDLATGTIQKLYRVGFKVLVLEIAKPMAIRRKVSLSEAVYDKEVQIEDIKAVLVKNREEINKAWNNDKVPIIVDEKGQWIENIKPRIVVDAILAKKNLGTKKDMADITVALGPGFIAGRDVDIVIETARGHNLGRLIFEGSAKKNTGVPGMVGGYSKERVLHSPIDGNIKNIIEIGTKVKKGEVIAFVDNTPIRATISGILRGIIRNCWVRKGLKIADIDPRISEKPNCYTISDKARNIAGGVLEAIFYMDKKGGYKLWKKEF